ncbi:hypothetical protein LV457_08710 [Mycobacterium sp. MYCO198283]|uniref:hypothetical protein n=1 Tax=Mycobacterium sp. MYCO198283 TaxID=2883505 RepID=UPI001E5B2547|nr:hypothetical protein [Mycobacterium sp. MYCO198283]MCG5432374.1 hypothetical protein [Mycobacterium sp. MYCO198283]
MALSLHDIQRWDPDSLATVSSAVTERAAGFRDTSRRRRATMAWVEWDGDADAHRPVQDLKDYLTTVCRYAADNGINAAFGAGLSPELAGAGALPGAVLGFVGGFAQGVIEAPLKAAAKGAWGWLTDPIPGAPAP